MITLCAGWPWTTFWAQATAAGRATGLVTTSQVTDASPAAFFPSTLVRSLAPCANSRAAAPRWWSPMAPTCWR